MKILAICLNTGVRCAPHSSTVIRRFFSVYKWRV